MPSDDSLPSAAAPIWRTTMRAAGAAISRLLSQPRCGRHSCLPVSSLPEAWTRICLRAATVRSGATWSLAEFPKGRQECLPHLVASHVDDPCAAAIWGTTMRAAGGERRSLVFCPSQGVADIPVCPFPPCPRLGKRWSTFTATRPKPGSAFVRRAGHGAVRAGGNHAAADSW